MGTTSRWMLAALAACSGADHGDDHVARDPCAALTIAVAGAAPSAAQRGGTAGALALWRDRGVTAFDAGPDAAGPGAIEVRFEDAAATFHGVYDPSAARVVINRDLADEATIAIVVAHELGHVFGLVHVAPGARLSVMNPGNLITPPTDDDQRALEARWGRCR